MIGIGELILLLVIGGIIFFGGKKVPELGRALGRFMGEFRKGKMDIEKELKGIKDDESE